MADVCIVTKAWRAGVAAQIHQLAAALARAGLDVTLIAPPADPARWDQPHPKLRRIRTPRERLAGPLLGRTAASLRRVLHGAMAALAERRHTSRYLFVLPDPAIFSLPLLVWLRLTGASIMLQVHDAEPHAWRLPPRWRRVEWFALWAGYRLASQLVVLTPSVAEALATGFGCDAARIAVIPHGPLALPPLPPLPGTGNLLLFGGLRRNKSILAVIEAVSTARMVDPELRLTLAGEPNPHEAAYWGACREALAASPAAFDVLPGHVPEEAIAPLFARSDALVLAYDQFHSASGVALLAALAGRPVIATRAGSLGLLFDAGMAGEVIASPPSPVSIGEAIHRFRQVPTSVWRQRAEDAKIRLSALSDWPAIAQAYVDLLGRAGPPRAANPAAFGLEQGP